MSPYRMALPDVFRPSWPPLGTTSSSAAWRTTAHPHAPTPSPTSPNDLDPSQVRAALVHLIAAHLAAGSTPTRAAIADLVNLLAGEPQPELTPREIKARGLAPDTDKPGRSAASPWDAESMVPGQPPMR